jgi:beta-aspartyl-peptidase (threonine type)
MVSLAVHGGAGVCRAPETRQNGLIKAVNAARKVLESGGDAVDAVVAAVICLENDEHFNAGYGSVLNAAGEVECDAGIKEGKYLQVGAVAGVRALRNPIQGALALLKDPTILLAGRDAERFALTCGIPLIKPATLISPARAAEFEGRVAVAPEEDTVGAVALDAAGNLAAATSTGGITRKPVGRIGDSPLPGCGYDAENGVGACSTTGWGESIARLTLARRALEFLERGDSPDAAAQKAIALLGSRIEGGHGGLILLSPSGELGVAWNTPAMSYATWSPGGGTVVHP